MHDEKDQCVGLGVDAPLADVMTRFESYRYENAIFPSPTPS